MNLTSFTIACQWPQGSCWAEGLQRKDGSHLLVLVLQDMPSPRGWSWAVPFPHLLKYLILHLPPPFYSRQAGCLAPVSTSFPSFLFLFCFPRPFIHLSGPRSSKQWPLGCLGKHKNRGQHLHLGSQALGFFKKINSHIPLVVEITQCDCSAGPSKPACELSLINALMGEAEESSVVYKPLFLKTVFCIYSL